VAVGAGATVQGSILAEDVRIGPGERVVGQVVTRAGRRRL
jgi:predicted acyltransferase (DUF342 family)